MMAEKTTSQCVVCIDHSMYVVCAVSVCVSVGLYMCGGPWLYMAVPHTLGHMAVCAACVHFVPEPVC